MTHFPIDEVVIGKHPPITLMMRGVYNTRPPQPKYSSTWDVGQVLRYIGSMRPNQNHTLKAAYPQLSYLVCYGQW